MRPYDPRKPIIYTHIPKCAGTSVIRLLRKWFGRGYHKLNQDETQDIVLPRIEAQDAEGNWLENVKCIHGHFNHGRGYGLPYFYPEIDQYFTILRDPFELVVSMYFFAKGRSINGEFWFRGEQVDIRHQFPTVESYVRSYPYWLFHHIPLDVTLANCESKMRERFVYVGLFEDLQTSIDVLGEVLGKPREQLPHMNISNYDEPVPAALRDQFYRDYPLLKRVYDFARDNYRNPVGKLQTNQTGSNAAPNQLPSKNSAASQPTRKQLPGSQAAKPGTVLKGRPDSRKPAGLNEENKTAGVTST